MPCNEWSASGDLLLDATDEGTSTSALHALATAVSRLPWPLLWLDEAVLDAPCWQQFRQALLQAGATVAEHPRWEVGRVEIDHDWPAYRARWSGKHRQQMAQATRRLTQRGDVRLALQSRLAPGDVAAAMQQCFEIEDRGWKGAAGSSVLRAPGMAAFFIRQARQAAQWDQLELAVLHCGARPVAFSYGLSAKGVFHSLKTGYDPDYAPQHPGQLLRCYLLEQLFADPERKALDFLGPMTESHAAWQPTPYMVGRLAVAPRGLMGRMVVRAYRDIWPRLRPVKTNGAIAGG
jgi:CelD/BcsL family acetyltransferase involved in cellulose biosynthesis